MSKKSAQQDDVLLPVEMLLLLHRMKTRQMQIKENGVGTKHVCDLFLRNTIDLDQRKTSECKTKCVASTYRPILVHSVHNLLLEAFAELRMKLLKVNFPCVEW